MRAAGPRFCFSPGIAAPCVSNFPLLAAADCVRCVVGSLALARRSTRLWASLPSDRIVRHQSPGRPLMMGNSANRSRVVFAGRAWVVILRGLVAIAFAVAALTYPAMTQAKLVHLFGLYALAHGVLSLAGAIGGRGQPGCESVQAEQVYQLGQRHRRV